LNIGRELWINKTGLLLKLLKLTSPISDALHDVHCLKYI